MPVFIFEVRDDEVVAALGRQARAAGIERGAVVSLIGAVESFRLSVVTAHAAVSGVTAHQRPAELTGTGEIVEGDVHLHVAMGVAGRPGALVGHLVEARVATHFVRAYVLPA